MFNTNSLQKRVKRHVKAKEHDFFVIVQPGFENTAVKEAVKIGISINEIEKGGFYFKGKLEDCYKLNLCGKTFTRILMRIVTFSCPNRASFIDKISNLPWELYLANDNFKISATTKKSGINHTGFIIEQLTKTISKRLALHEKNPTQTIIQTIYARIIDNKCTLSIDTSGDDLYKRGKRILNIKAPIRETLASLILTEANCTEYDMIIDPMCGSGTFAIEANNLMMQTLSEKTDFPFMAWPVFSENTWKYLIKEFKKNKSIQEYKIFASDINPKASEATRENLKQDNIQDNIMVETHNFFELDIKLNKKTLLVLNPPYGERLKNANIRDFYGKIGNILNKKYSECGIAIIVPNKECEKALSLKHNRKISFTTGGLKVSVLFRDLF